jgi:death on curing protein
VPPRPSPYALLTADDVVAIYADTLKCSTTTALDLLRSRAGLEGAIGRLQAHIDYEYADLATLAAVLAHGIAEGQHFLDGNKRTAFAATAGFLELNGYDLNESDDTLAQWIIELSAGLTVFELANEMRQCLRPL